MSFEFKVVTPEGTTYQDNIKKVSVPTTGGDIVVLEGHGQLVSTLGSGELTITKQDDHDVSLAVTGGVLEVRATGEVYILADNAERAEDIDLDRAKKARDRAEELLKQQENIADVDFARMQAMINRETTRINVGNKYRK